MSDTVIQHINDEYSGVKLFRVTADNKVDFSPFKPYIRRYSQPNIIMDTVPGKDDERSRKVEDVFCMYKLLVEKMLENGCLVRAPKTTYSTGVFPGPFYMVPVDVDRIGNALDSICSLMIGMVDWMLANRQKLV